MKTTNTRLWFYLTVLFAVAVTIYTLSYVVTEPWHAMPGTWGDGVKNEFSYLYQIMYGKGMWFDGMNYPYGDNIVFSDGQAALSVPLSYCKGITPEVALTILWWLISLSYILSIVFIYRILLHFRVSPAVASIFAVLIGIFSPQTYRVCAHFGLSYMCVVPMLFYWTIQYHKQVRYKYCIYIFLLGLFASFLHPYFSGLVLVWGASYAMGYFIFTRTTARDKIRHIAPLIGSVFAMLATVALIMHFTDPVKDRTVTPYGMFAYNTHFNDIFTSPRSPVWLYVREHHMLRDIFPFISEGGEGYTYIGLVVTIALILSLFTGIVNRIKKNNDRLIVSQDGFPVIWLFMAVVALLFSMGVPYIWNMMWLLDYASFMKQFRSLGRFAWIFYHITTVYGVVIMYRFYLWTAGRNLKPLGYTIFILAISIWGYEAYNYLQGVKEVVQEAPDHYRDFFSKEEKSWNTFLQEHKRKQTDFQAILILPFFHIGSDKLWVGDPGWKLALACKAGYQMHLPIVDALMSRTSWEQTFKIVKTVAGPYAYKPTLRELRSDKPLLLLRFTREAIDPDQAYLLKACDSIGNFSGCDVYVFYPERQIANDSVNAESIAKILPDVQAGADTCIGQGEWYVNHWDNGKAAGSFFGSGAMPHINTDNSVVAVVPIKPLHDTQEYEFSVWSLLSNKDYMSPCVYLQSLDSAGNQIEEVGMNSKWSVDNYNMWFRGSLYFRLRANCRAVRCKVTNQPNPTYKIMDEIQLRPADAIIISKSKDGKVLVNNHIFPPAP